MQQKEKMEKYRSKIEALDEKVFKLLEKRFEVVVKVGEYKKLNSLPIRNIEREKLLIEKAAKKTILKRKFIEKFYQLLFEYAYDIEK